MADTVFHEKWFARFERGLVGLTASVKIVRMYTIQPALVRQLLEGSSGELRAGGIEVVERRVWSGRPDHDGCAIGDETKPLFALSKRPPGAPGSRQEYSQSDNRPDQCDEDKRGRTDGGRHGLGALPEQRDEASVADGRFHAAESEMVGSCCDLALSARASHVREQYSSVQRNDPPRWTRSERSRHAGLAAGGFMHLPNAPVL